MNDSKQHISPLDGRFDYQRRSNKQHREFFLTKAIQALRSNVNIQQVRDSSASAADIEHPEP